MSKIPKKLAQLIDEFRGFEDQNLAADVLIEFADEFVEVPESVAVRPFEERNLVPGCESEAYIWAKKNEDGSLKYHFAVENPQGISAMAMAVILDQTLSGAPLDEVSKVQSDIVYDFFGKGISMGKGQGLMSMVSMCRHFAEKYLNGFSQD